MARERFATQEQHSAVGDSSSGEQLDIFRLEVHAGDAAMLGLDVVRELVGSLEGITTCVALDTIGQIVRQDMSIAAVAIPEGIFAPRTAHTILVGRAMGVPLRVGRATFKSTLV